MKRREFVAGLAGSAAWHGLAKAQPHSPTIGFLNSRSFAESKALLGSFEKGLAEAGYSAGKNAVIEYRWSGGRYDELPALAKDLVARQVAVIVAGGGPASPIAAKNATSTIPIVFVGGSDPVRTGLVSNLSRPGENVTGILNSASALTAKRLALTRELLPEATKAIVLVNPRYPEADAQLADVRRAANEFGLNIAVLNITDESEFDRVDFWDRTSVVFVANDPFFSSQRSRLAALMAQRGVVATYPHREYAEAGGLLSYGTNFVDLYREAGLYAGRILDGQKPGELPVLTPSRFELVINLKTAKTLGLTIPSSLLARADEVIE